MRRLVLGCLLLAGCDLVDAQQHTARLRACNDQASDPAAVFAACTGLLGDSALKPEERGYVLYWRAQASLRGKDTDAALHDLDALVKLEPGLAIAHGLRGAVHGTRGDLASAIRDFDRALELDPSSVDSLGNRGKALADSGKHERAIADFSRAIELAPGNAVVQNGRCWSRAVLGIDLKAALADCSEAIRLAPKDGNNFNSQAFVRFKLGDYAGAIDDYGRAIGMSPGIASSYYMRGRAKQALGDPSAMQDIERGLTGEPGVASRYAGYGVAIP